MDKPGRITITITDLPGDGIGIASDPPLEEILKQHQAGEIASPAMFLGLMAMNKINDEAVLRGNQVHR